MRKYEKIICNQCKKELKSDGKYLKEGCFSVDYTFGYFSRKDGARHRFDLCEDCYDKMIAQFAIPVEEDEETELC
ncbi:MAG: hypothetical protein NC092_00135 [Butyrivibrio sp.]|nr:hypothetical protein [Muribaculum sp.]MCM1551082.1 hypothetical protein [Butyrivibrio sp.]